MSALRDRADRGTVTFGFLLLANMIEELLRYNVPNTARRAAMTGVFQVILQIELILLRCAGITQLLQMLSSFLGPT